MIMTPEVYRSVYRRLEHEWAKLKRASPGKVTDDMKILDEKIRLWVMCGLVQDERDKWISK